VGSYFSPFTMSIVNYPCSPFFYILPIGFFPECTSGRGWLAIFYFLRTNNLKYCVSHIINSRYKIYILFHTEQCPTLPSFMLAVYYLFSLSMSDWLKIAKGPASSISAIFRTRTSAITYKQYIEMKEGMGQTGQLYGELWEGKKRFSLL
jgi:hypothetical protein